MSKFWSKILRKYFQMNNFIDIWGYRSPFASKVLDWDIYLLLTLIYRRWSPEPTQPTQASAGRTIADKWSDQMAGNLLFFWKKTRQNTRCSSIFTILMIFLFYKVSPTKEMTIMMHLSGLLLKKPNVSSFYILSKTGFIKVFSI